jgi:hypothetical protein
MLVRLFVKSRSTSMLMSGVKLMSTAASNSAMPAYHKVELNAENMLMTFFEALHKHPNGMPLHELSDFVDSNILSQESAIKGDF